MEERKKTAVYVLVWKSELKPEDGGSFERAIEAQKKLCLDFLKNRGDDPATAAVYTSRRDLFIDIERGGIGRLVVRDARRLGSEDEIEGVLFELKMRGVELLTVE